MQIVYLLDEIPYKCWQGNVYKAKYDLLNWFLSKQGSKEEKKLDKVSLKNQNASFQMMFDVFHLYTDALLTFSNKSNQVERKRNSNNLLVHLHVL